MIEAFCKPLWKLITGQKKQAIPCANNMKYAAALVIDELTERAKVGKDKYGTELQPFNGRSSLLDLYQELLDAVVYCRNEIAEREHCTGGIFPAENSVVISIKEYERLKNNTEMEQVAYDKVAARYIILKRFDLEDSKMLGSQRYKIDRPEHTVMRLNALIEEMHNLKNKIEDLEKDARSVD